MRVCKRSTPSEGIVPGRGGPSALSEVLSRGDDSGTLMFARYFTYVDYPFDQVSRLMRQANPTWLTRLDGDSGSELLARVGVRLAGIPVYKHVRLEPGRAELLHTSKVLMPLAWHTSGGPPLFPEMEGQLEAEPFGSERTQLTLSATYKPPLGALGDALNRAVLYRLGDATLYDFTGRVIENLRSELESRPKAGSESPRL